MTHGTKDAESVTGVILAGGQARRMGGEDKGLITIAGEPMVQRVLKTLRPQTDAVVINANRNIDYYKSLGVPVLSDQRSGFLGPLSGMATAMAAVDTPWIVSVPCDSPFVPPDLVARLLAEASGNEIVTAHDGSRLQPVFSLVSTTLLASLNAFLDAGERKIDRWFYSHLHTTADFSDIPATFININTPEERAAVERSVLAGDYSVGDA